MIQIFFPAHTARKGQLLEVTNKAVEISIMYSYWL
jgi:hypothetical protein